VQFRRQRLRKGYHVHKNTQYRQLALVAKINKRPLARTCELPAGGRSRQPAGEGDVKVLSPLVVTEWAYTIIWRRLDWVSWGAGTFTFTKLECSKQTEAALLPSAFKNWKRASLYMLVLGRTHLKKEMAESVHYYWAVSSEILGSSQEEHKGRHLTKK